MSEFAREGTVLANCSGRARELVPKGSNETARGRAGGKPSAHPLGEDLSKVYSGRERWPRPEGAKTNPPADSSLIRRRGRACIVEGEARGSRGPSQSYGTQPTLTRDVLLC